MLVTTDDDVCDVAVTGSTAGSVQALPLLSFSVSVLVWESHRMGLTIVLMTQMVALLA